MTTTRKQTSASTAELLDVVVRLAPALRAAGVGRVEIPGTVIISLEPETPVLPKASRARPDELAALDDPDTFNGASVPGYPALKRPRNEEPLG